MLDSLNPSQTESQTTLASSTSFLNYNIMSTKQPSTPPVLITDSETAAWTRCRKLEDTLEAVSSAINTFPNRMLRLDSPSIRVLRNSNSSDESTIDALRQVFPQTRTLLLSALAALLILDVYVSSIESMQGLIGEPRPDHPNGKYWQLAAKSNECFHDIPTKARATLVIHMPSVAKAQVHERALRRRAETVAVCVRVQGQKLLDAICGGHNDLLWRTLKVLVDTLEKSSM